ncbi:MAG TPA: class A beta-lactamase [Caulobacteraceae bacterium]|jgi:beta-lactamase class A|nr:class A beta-lactamase [Caulobacteraceae bacterium]
MRQSRRGILAGLSSAALAGPALAAGVNPFEALERKYGGRLGVYVYDTGSRRSLGWRQDERFSMCSTFKALAVADVLARVDAGRERLDRRIAYGEKDLLEYAPTTRAHVKDGALTLDALCAAAVELSDNTAANLILAALGGPAEVTRFARSLGDPTTRLDRNEPTLNRPEGEHDTTTPSAYAHTMAKILLGDVLKPASRAKLEGWMHDETPGRDRVRKGLPASWRSADKPGTGRTQTNDVVLARPPHRAPLLIGAYYESKDGGSAAAQALMQAVGRSVAKWAP